MKLISTQLKIGISIFMMVIFFINPMLTQGQPSYKIEVGGTLDNQEIYLDTLSFSNAVYQKLSTYRDEGYLTVALDSISKTKETVIAHIRKGFIYEYGDISVSKENQTLINAAGLRRYNWKNKNISPEQIKMYSEEVIVFLENNGYPFAQVSLDSISINQNKINAEVNIDKGGFIVWDSLVLSGETNISEQYMRQYLQVHKGGAFDKRQFDNLGKRINELPFLKLTKSPDIRFWNNKAKLDISTEPIKSNRFDFLIGILPSVGDDGLKKYVITGEFTAELYNKLGFGEYIFASFERLRPEVQELDLKFRYPYLAGLPLGINTQMKVYRRSGDFLELNTDLGFDYQLSGLSHLLFGWSYKTSRLIDVDTSSIISQNKLPSNLDVTLQGGQIGFNYQNLDYKYNPASGWDINVSATIGQKSIIPNATILEIEGNLGDFSDAYDTLQLKSFQTQSFVDIAYYLPLAKLITLKTGVKGGLISNQSMVFDNEYYRLGGYKLLRGFDEQSVLAESYGIVTTEFRLLLNRSSYLTLPFIDFGYTKVKVGDLLEWDQVLGVGLGLSFSTPAGLFNVSFASGSRLGEPIDFGNTKVHFGYVSLF